MKKLIEFFKHFFLAPFIIFVFNKMGVVLDVYIPFNFFTVLIIGLLDIYGLVMLVFVYFFLVM